MRRVIVLAPLLAGCPPSDVIVDDIPVDARPFFDATTDAGPSFDATLDAGADADAFVFGGGGPFLCGDCICDGTSSLCYSPHDASADASEAGACSVDASTCWPFPIACLPKPTCACLEKYWTDPSCTCGVDPTGNGIVLVCP